MLTKEQLIKELYELIDLWSHRVPYEDDNETDYEVIETHDLKELIKKFEENL
jgi:hypothetical protein